MTRAHPSLAITSKPGVVVGKRWLAMCGWEISAGAKADTAALQTGGRASVNSFL